MDTNNTDGHTMSDMDCPSCKGVAKIQSLRIKIEGRGPSMISSVSCDNCGLKDNLVFDSISSGNEGKAIKIACVFDSADDLKRYIDLQKMASVKFKKNDDTYEYSSGKSGTFLVESIIRESIDELKALYGIRTNDDDLPTHLGNDKNMRSVGLIDSDKFSVRSVDDRESVCKAVEMLQNILEHPVFELEITDESGETRVLPIDKKPTEIDVDNLEDFDDKKVTHIRYSKEKKSE